MLPNLDLLKLAQIFNPGSASSPMNPNPGVIMDDPRSGGLSGNMGEPDLMTAIQGLLQPKDTQFSRFEDMIGAIPNRADYAPSKTRQVLAAIAGLGTGGPVGISGGQPIGYQSNLPEGLKVQRSINDEPYSKALTDWSTKAEPLGELAKMEQTRNVGNRATGIGILQRKQADDKLNETQRHAMEVEEQGRKKLEIQQQRADAYIKAKQFAMEHPTYKAVTDENGEIVFWNPTDPEKTIRSGINSGDIGDIQKSELKVEGDLKAIKARAAAAQALEGTRQGNRIDLERTRYPDGRPNKTSSDAATPTQQRTARALAASDIKIQHPEWSKWIKINKGEVSVTPPSSGGFLSSGPDKNTYDEIVAALGLAKSETATPNQTLKPEPPRVLDDARTKAARSKVEPGNILITDGKGNFGQIKAADASKLANGWMVVK